MIFEKLIIKNYKKFEYLEVQLNNEVNIIVGNNESGKSTILEALNLVASSKLHGKPINTSLSTSLFNNKKVEEYIQSIKDGTPIGPPEIEIELFAQALPVNSEYKGKNNSKCQDVPGIKLSINFNYEQYGEIYQKLVEDKKLTDLPIEFYKTE